MCWRVRVRGWAAAAILGWAVCATSGRAAPQCAHGESSAACTPPPVRRLNARGAAAELAPHFEREHITPKSAFASLFLRVLAERADPDSPIIRQDRPPIPDWHPAMLNDRARNSAYRRAIHKAVGADDVVLDIGTGAGLLSMYAAQAGARQVVTFEGNHAVHTLAQDVFRENGFSAGSGLDAPIISHHGLSTTAEVGVHMPQRATVLVAELMDTTLIGERMVSAFAHAQRELLVAGAITIPARGRFCFMVIESRRLRASKHVEPDAEAGLDLSAVNQAMMRASRTNIHLGDLQWSALSGVEVALEMDFSNSADPFGTGKLGQIHDMSLNVTSDGTVDGLAVWWEVDLDDDITISTDPRQGTSHVGHWSHTVIQNRPLAVRHGDQLQLLVGLLNDELKVEVYRVDKGTIA